MKKNESQRRIGSPELVTKKECLLPKQDVEGSNPFTRSTFCLVEIRGYANLHSPLSF